MGVRLNKVLSELNIGLQTVVDYLNAHPSLGIIKDDATPNTKISDEQYSALLKEYGGTWLITIPWRTDDFSDDPQLNRDFVNSHGWHDLRRDTMIVMPNRSVLIPKNQACDSFLYWSENDLKENNYKIIKFDFDEFKGNKWNPLKLAFDLYKDNVEKLEA